MEGDGAEGCVAARPQSCPEPGTTRGVPESHQCLALSKQLGNTLAEVVSSPQQLVHRENRLPPRELSVLRGSQAELRTCSSQAASAPVPSQSVGGCARGVQLLVIRAGADFK